MTDTPKSLLAAVRYYSDLDRCEKKMIQMRWNDGKPTCPHCGCRNVGRIESRRLFKCRKRECRKQFSVKVGTIFEDSPLGLDKWFVAVWCIANCKNGISSHELSRALGVTQKTAWFMLHRIREAMKTGSFRKMDGPVEVDETFVGGKSANMHKHKREQRITGRGGVNKTVVQGVLERGGKVRTFVAAQFTGRRLRQNVYDSVEPGTPVYSDDARHYRKLIRKFVHSTVDHSIEFVRGAVHVNGIENFWSLLKRTIKGTYVRPAPFHLHRYCHEQAWRFNNRKIDDASRFDALLKMVSGRRLTYRRLCAINDSGFMGIS